MRIPQTFFALIVASTLLTSCGAQVTEPVVPATEIQATIAAPSFTSEAEASPTPVPPANTAPAQSEEQFVLSSFPQPITVAGDILILYGHVLDASGGPLSGYAVEIWQVDANGSYDHPNDPSTQNRDLNFQFYGSSVTDENGLYLFRTIVPARYEPRPRHIHFKVKKDGSEVLTSQFYFAGDVRENERLLLELKYAQDANGNPVNVAFKDIVVNTGTGGDLNLTPTQQEGPYYPVADVAAFDNDLASIE
jgi:protocatechuate 3,4-dioxygenase beta subunit